MSYDEKLTQRFHRKWRTFKDQHGRKWGVEFDTRTNSPCGRWQPQFLAPITPPSHVLYTGRDEERPNLVWIDYQQWRGESLNAGRDYHALAVKYGVELHGDTFDSSKPYSAQLRARLGSAPYPPVLLENTVLSTPVIDALEDGQDYLLGARAYDPKDPEDDELKNYVFPKIEGRRTWGQKDKKPKKDTTLKMAEA